MGQIARRDDEIGCDAFDERSETPVDRGVLARAEVQVGDVENPHSHRRLTL
jgi:hypothetical protein